MIVIQTYSYYYSQSESSIENLILQLQERVALLLTHISKENAVIIRDLLFQEKRLKDYLISGSITALLSIEPYRDSLHGLPMLHNDVNTHLSPAENIQSYLNILQVRLPQQQWNEPKIMNNSLFLCRLAFCTEDWSTSISCRHQLAFENT